MMGSLSSFSEVFTHPSPNSEFVKLSRSKSQASLLGGGGGGGAEARVKAKNKQVVLYMFRRVGTSYPMRTSATQPGYVNNKVG